MVGTMKITGFADEASPSLEKQIAATKELGWEYISARGIDGKNIHDLSDSAFESAAQQLNDANILVPEFGSLLGSWAKPIDSDFNLTLGEIERCIPRMKRLGASIVRVMSYAQEEWGEEQHEEERFQRLRLMVNRFSAEGITVAHENCMNWGGFSADHTIRLINEVPGLKLIFDTGNPVFQRDRSRPNADGIFPWQDALEFYQAVKEHIVHIHIKDCLNPVDDETEPEYTMPGKGQGYVKEILQDLKDRSYEGFIAIEPHIATVFHLTDGQEPDWQQCYDSYVQYGRDLDVIIQSLS